MGWAGFGSAMCLGIMSWCVPSFSGVTQRQYRRKVRTLEPMLAASASEATGPGRVIWQSSLEALPEFYDPGDWQVVKSKVSYHASKYHMDLVGAELSRRALQDNPQRVLHVLVEPGVVHTSIDLLLISAFLHHIKHWAFYFVSRVPCSHCNTGAYC
jgi:3-keto steroid reductase